ncbi:MAG TPA: cytochrome d ubiquinol oxidase subunit II, partial [Alphaproteobacteria bacterium]|nr:cytochrome d ubiquinol oxidase subunit II [Alphaproteobacteria bacterium]
WRRNWDIALFLGGFGPALVLGLALGNVILGVPYHFTPDMEVVYTGAFYELFTPFPLLCGVLCVLVCARQGAAYLCIKTQGDVQQRASFYLGITNLSIIVLFSVLSFWALKYMDGFEVTSPLTPNGPSNPLYKTVTQSPGWMAFKAYPLLYAVPGLVLIFSLVTQFFKSLDCSGLSFISSSLSTAMLLATFGVSLFPFLLPSSTHLGHSLTVFDASSSHLTLFIMLLVTVLFLPIVLTYISWAYRVMRGPVNQEEVNQREGAY